MKHIDIAIVGVGALGKRHLESVLKSSWPMDVYCIDMNPQALDAFKWEDSFENKKLHFATDFTELPTKLDWALFAMSSAGRREIFDALVEKVRVPYIVFEKVLFQRESDYAHVAARLSELGIKAWVNCARRVQDCYRQLRDEMVDMREFELHVSGGEWGLACNAIHMIDLVEYLSGCKDTEVSRLDLEDIIVDSKRKGYKEVYGLVAGHSGRCRNFTISCCRESRVPVQIDIVSDRVRVRIEEGRGIMTIASEGNQYVPEERPFRMKYQSQLTQDVLESIVSTGNCGLARFEDSARLHLQFIRPLIKFFEDHGMEKGVCPIT